MGVEQIIWSAGSEAELQRIEQRLRTHYPSTYTNTLNGITFVDGVDPDENRVLITYPTPEQLPREVIVPLTGRSERFADPSGGSIKIVCGSTTFRSR